jgi:hypothetical protein
MRQEPLVDRLGVRARNWALFVEREILKFSLQNRLIS